MGNGQGSRVKKVFVGGIPNNATEEEIRQYFGQYGTVSAVLTDLLRFIVLLSLQQLSSCLIVPCQKTPHGCSDDVMLSFSTDHRDGIEIRQGHPAHARFATYLTKPKSYTHCTTVDTCTLYYYCCDICAYTLM